VQHGVVYLQDEDANVYALALATGKLKWECQLNLPERSGPGPDGVAVADGTVYGDWPASVFALSAATGKTIWVDRHLLNRGQGAFEIQPQVADGRVYLASAYGSGPGGGMLMALNASTGRLRWKFNTVIGAGPGVHALGIGSGGARETPLAGSDGSVTFGAATVSDDLVFTTLYDGALIALDRDTGAIVYRRQLPTSANAPIAVFGNTVLVPAGGPQTSGSGGGGHPQLVAYTVR
jgi:outer membrane protein assembly factor BamB